MSDTLKIHGDDNVAVLVVPRGSIPGGHKVALSDIAPGAPIVKYGLPIGEAASPIKAGDHVHVHNMRTLLSETSAYTYRSVYSADINSSAAEPIEVPIPVYRRADGRIGIRNEIWLIPTVGCVNATVEKLAAWGEAQFCDPDSGGAVDAVVALSHPYGCSQMGDDHRATRRILADLAKHPNAAAVLVVALGCENNTLDQFRAELGDYAADTDRIAFMTCQDAGDELAVGKALLTKLAAHAKTARRSEGHLSDLVLGLKCGGSDGYSGITANALVGRVVDSHTNAGGTALLSEVPEMFGAEQLLMNRAASQAVFDKIVALITDFKDYYKRHNQVVYENPSPGNKAGGITTLEDKSCGCVQKGGQAAVTDVLRYGERCGPNTRGLVLLEGPGNDIVSCTALAAAGAHLILFTTGRGTPLGGPVPTVKIASNTPLAQAKKAWIDYNAGKLLEPGNSLDSLADELLAAIADLASGMLRTRNEENGYRQIAVFKNGVTL